MSDINFFEPYKGKNKQKINSDIYVYCLVGLAIAFIVITLLWNNISMVFVNKSITELDNNINNEEVQQQANEYEVATAKYAVYNEYNSELTEVVEAIESRQIVSLDLLDDLSSTLPSEVSFNTINISSGEVTIQAESTSREAIAELQYNLEQLDRIESVYIGSISGDGTYTFDVNCVLKDDE